MQVNRKLISDFLSGFQLMLMEMLEMEFSQQSIGMDRINKKKHAIAIWA